MQNSLAAAAGAPPNPEVFPFELTFLHGVIRVCYGCGIDFSEADRTNPNDLVIRKKDFRHFYSPTTHQLQVTPKRQNTYYHLNKLCVRRKYREFVPTDVLNDLNLSADHAQRFDAFLGE